MIDHDVSEKMLSVQELLAGSSVIHEIHIPREILSPGTEAGNGNALGTVRLRPLSVAALAVIVKAAQDDPNLVSLLMIRESAVEPNLTLEQIRRMHVGLVNFLVSSVNMISGLGPDGDTLDNTVNSPLGRTHILLAKHFGWTPDQVSRLTPGQVAVYLAGIEKLMQLEEKRDG